MLKSIIIQDEDDETTDIIISHLGNDEIMLETREKTNTLHPHSIFIGFPIKELVDSLIFLGIIKQ